MKKILCVSCSKRCRGSVLKISDDAFLHKDCFKCSVCETKLERGGFYRRDNSLFCPNDYQAKFGNKCHKCQTYIDGEVITIVGRTFHFACFTCSSCRQQFSPGDRAIIFENEYYCSQCTKKRRSLTEAWQQSTKINLSTTTTVANETNGDKRDNRSDLCTKIGVRGELNPNNTTDNKNTSSELVYTHKVRTGIEEKANPNSSAQRTTAGSSIKSKDQQSIFTANSVDLNHVQPQNSSEYFDQLCAGTRHLTMKPPASTPAAVLDSQQHPSQRMGRNPCRSRAFQDSHSHVMGAAVNKKYSTLPGDVSAAAAEEDVESESLFYHTVQLAESFLLRQQTSMLLMGIPSKDQYRRFNQSASSTPRCRSPHYHRPQSDSFSFRNIPSYRKGNAYEYGGGVSQIGRLLQSKPSTSRVLTTSRHHQHHQQHQQPAGLGSQQQCSSATDMMRPESTANQNQSDLSGSRIIRMAAMPSGGSFEEDLAAIPIHKSQDPANWEAGTHLMDSRARQKSSTLPISYQHSIQSNDTFLHNRFSVVKESPDQSALQSRDESAVYDDDGWSGEPANCSSVGVPSCPSTPRPTEGSKPMVIGRASNWSLYQQQQLANARLLQQARVNQAARLRHQTHSNQNLLSACLEESQLMQQANQSAPTSRLLGSTGQLFKSSGGGTNLVDEDSANPHSRKSMIRCAPSVTDWLRPVGVDSLVLNLPYPYCKTPKRPYKIIPYSTLSDKSSRPAGLETNQLEAYLSDQEFQAVLKLSRDLFYSLPEWKRNDLKHQCRLFSD